MIFILLFNKGWKLFSLIFLFGGLIFSEDYKIQFSTIPIGQGLSENNSVGVMNSVGSMISKDVSSDSFTVGSGFLQTTQNVFSEPPVISTFRLPALIQKNGESIPVKVSLYDLNGISAGKRNVEITGGSENTFCVVCKKPDPTVNESELTSFDIIEPTLFITPTELFSDNPCPIGIVENCIL
jgi:hypothetical protein